MTKTEISKILRYYRRLSGLTGPEVIYILKEKGVRYSVKALYNWETGRSQPDCDTFIKLCEIYGIENVLHAFGYTPIITGEKYSLCKTDLLNKFNQLDDEKCKIVSAYIDGLLNKRI
ncbi:MAG: XRE family transcriptional regulator [Clostridia bacterium]|nr:XRE family transcriptional regulator [Clostridia bacterium]